MKGSSMAAKSSKTSRSVFRGMSSHNTGSEMFRPAAGRSAPDGTGGDAMKRMVTLLVMLAAAAPVLAQQTTGGGAAMGQGRAQGPAYTAPKNDAVPPADPYV